MDKKMQRLDMFPSPQWFYENITRYWHKNTPEQTKVAFREFVEAGHAMAQHERGVATLPAYVVNGWSDDAAEEVDGTLISPAHQTKVFTTRKQALDFVGTLDNGTIETWQDGECVAIDDACDIQSEYCDQEASELAHN